MSLCLNFPDLATLRLALAGGLIPVPVAIERVLAERIPPKSEAEPSQPERTGVRLWASRASDFPPDLRRDLEALGVSFSRHKPPAQPERDLPHWGPLLETIPSPEDERALGVEGLTVLLTLPRPRLGEVVGELLRLGRNRITYRLIEPLDTSSTPDSSPRPLALLKVVGPPYYTLLRALETTPNLNGHPTIAAYLERRPGVWSRWGHTHPLIDRFTPPEGGLLLIDPPDHWRVVPAGAFRDIQETVAYQLPATPVLHVSPATPETVLPRIPVPLRLCRGGSADPAELWVLRHNALDTMESLVATASDELLGRLLFAVVEPSNRDQPLVVLKARPSKSNPPTLALNAVAYRPHLRLNNLFVPVGMRVNPPLRRDQITQLLANDPDRLHWLTVTDQADGNDDAPRRTRKGPSFAQPFVVESIADVALTPLEKWVDYLLDRDRDLLQAWNETALFEFDRFLCRDGKPLGGGSPPPPREPQRSPQTRPGTEPRPRAPINPTPPTPPPPPPNVTGSTAFDPSSLAVKGERDDLRRRLDETQARFRDRDTPPDDPERIPLWVELANLETALSEPIDASICWSQAIWWSENPPPSWWSRWVAIEFAHPSAGNAQVVDPANPADLLESIRTLLNRPQPSQHEVRKTIVGLIALGRPDAPLDPALLNELRPVWADFLRRHEHLLSIRCTWLAWRTLAHLSGQDALTLARARDRLLLRMQNQGPRWDLDLPSFLKAGPGDPENEKPSSRAGSSPTVSTSTPLVADRYRDLADIIRRWMDPESRGGQSPGITTLSSPRTSAKPARRGERLLRGRDRGESSAATRPSGLNSVSGGRDQYPVAPACERDLVELILAFGHARLGEASRVHNLIARLEPLADPAAEPVRQWLRDAYRQRVFQALEGKIIREYSPELTERLNRLNITERIKLGYLERETMILVPHGKLDPYLHQRQGTDSIRLGIGQDQQDQRIKNRLSHLQILPDLDTLETELTQLLDDPETKREIGARRLTLGFALRQATRLGERFASRCLQELSNLVKETRLDASPGPSGELLERGIALAAHFDLAEPTRLFSDHLLALVESHSGETITQLEPAIVGALQGLRRVGALGRVDELGNRIHTLVLIPESGDPTQFRYDSPERRSNPHLTSAVLRILLGIAQTRLHRGDESTAWPVLDQAEAMLRSRVLMGEATAISRQTHVHQNSLALRYVETLGAAAQDQALERAARLFQDLDGIEDFRVSRDLFSLARLQLIERAVLSLTSESIQLSARARRFVEEEEYLLRLRIHRDTRAALAAEASA